ncbi:MAG: LptF/LptG family permease [Victivallales bacterium]|nr:LptF/LptG family permease [bacterium]MDD7750973.1 LptF/LptG family permease [bacterium]MDY5696926.1 LptF/LptG family permease [Victivallales bacterium]
MTNDERKYLKTVSKGRTFLWLPILDCYVLREFLIPFSVLAFTFTLLFLIGDVFNDLSDFLEHKTSFFLAAKYFILKMPGNIRFVLPISVLLSCMYCIANLGRTREITAMRASGLSMVRCGGAIYIAALCVTFVNFWFNEQLVPDCDMSAKVLIKSLGDRKYEERMYSMLQFRSSDKTRDWLFTNFDKGGTQKRVILKQYKTDENGHRYIAWDLQADEAEYTPSGWIFRGVKRTPYSEILHVPGAEERLGELRFTPDQIPETVENIGNAIRPPDELSSAAIWRILKDNPTMVDSLRNVYQTILYYRLAFPWVCFLCVFLGLPLAAKNERAGVFLSIVTAVGAIVVFQMMTEIFLVLGKQGYIPPFIGGVGPTLAFLFYSYFFVIRKST